MPRECLRLQGCVLTLIPELWMSVEHRQGWQQGPDLFAMCLSCLWTALLQFSSSVAVLGAVPVGNRPGLGTEGAELAAAPCQCHMPRGHKGCGDERLSSAGLGLWIRGVCPSVQSSIPRGAVLALGSCCFLGSRLKELVTRSAGTGAGAVCGAGAAGCWPQPLFPQLEQHPKQCVGGTDPLTSVTSCFPSRFSGKAAC